IFNKKGGTINNKVYGTISDEIVNQGGTINNWGHVNGFYYTDAGIINNYNSFYVHIDGHLGGTINNFGAFYVIAMGDNLSMYAGDTINNSGEMDMDIWASYCCYG